MPALKAGMVKHKGQQQRQQKACRLQYLHQQQAFQEFRLLHLVLRHLDYTLANIPL
jgi:hypothetical protein